MDTRLTIRPARWLGFTLLELTLVITILGIIAALTAPLLLMSLQAYDGTHASINTLSRLRYATERLAREIRAVNYTATEAYAFNTMSTNASTQPLVFTKVDGTQVTISATSSQATIAYANPAISEAVLTDQLGSVAFAYFDATGTTAVTASSTVRYVDIVLTLTNPYNGQAYSQRVRVGLRDRS